MRAPPHPTRIPPLPTHPVHPPAGPHPFSRPHPAEARHMPLATAPHPKGAHNATPSACSCFPRYICKPAKSQSRTVFSSTNAMLMTAPCGYAQLVPPCPPPFRPQWPSREQSEHPSCATIPLVSTEPNCSEITHSSSAPARFQTHRIWPGACLLSHSVKGVDRRPDGIRLSGCGKGNRLAPRTRKFQLLWFNP